MKSRDRFRETMRYGAPDRVPYFEEGIRDDVLRAWRRQGLKRRSEFEAMFRHDRREEVHPDLEPLPRLKQGPSLREDIDRLRRRLNPDDARRLPRKWPIRAQELNHGEGVETLIFVSWANPRPLIPAAIERGFNCLWAYEADPQAMDYRELRREFGRELRLIGGVDLDVLRQGESAIRREFEEKVPALLADGGYIPMLDGRVRVDVPFENYRYYKRLLEKTIGVQAVI
jgi:hypothetical protein